MGKNIYIIILITLAALSGCKKENKVGKYLYVDSEDVVHTDNECPNIKGGVSFYEVGNVAWERESESQKDYYEHGDYVKRTHCARCYDEEAIEEIQKRLKDKQ